MPLRPAPVKKRPLSAKARARLAKKRLQWAIIILTPVLIAGLILLLTLPGKGRQDPTVSDAPAEEVSPSPTPYVEPTPAPTAQPIVYLPVITKGSSANKRVAVTIDDLFQVDNLESVMELTRSLGGKLTLFPIGRLINEKDDLKRALRKAYSYGFEIENHTYSHTALYSLNDEEMAREIWMQNMYLCAALGVNYEPHFLRMMGGNGEYDLRSHQYLVQLGTYKGIAHWSYSGSDADLNHIKKHTENGFIVLFHATNRDFKILQEYIPWLISQGYEMVTLNEMFGIEPNATSPLTDDPFAREMPKPYPFVYTQYENLGTKQYKQLYAVQLLQGRLKELGYLPENAVVDGDYGFMTKAAVELFQKNNNLSSDGIAGKATQTLLFSDDAPANPGPAVTPSPAPKK
ncbi:MAG: polysaccharide deacetylase family protein [Clostridiales bacterium]|nr:polysaccharide deacetylase family protein [Clostridiales bacterium]